MVTLTTLAGIAAVWVAIEQSRLKHNALFAERTAVGAREAESKQKKRADVTLADMQTARGLLAGERGAAPRPYSGSRRRRTSWRPPVISMPGS